MDPYKVLQVPYTASLEEIRENFKKIVLKVHPDRGGNAKDFQTVKDAYRYLYKYKKEQRKQHQMENRNMKELKQQRTTENRNMKKSYEKINDVQKIKATAKNFDGKKFNMLFNEFKTEDADSRGYETVKSSENRPDASDILKQHNAPKQKQIAIIEEPEPMELCTSNHKKIGLKHVDDFSKTHSNGQGFTDYNSAYTNRETLESMGNVRKDSRLESDVSVQMGAYKNNRKNISYEMNPLEQAKYNLRQQEKTADEELRRFNASRQDQIAARQFQRMQNFITM